MCYDNSDAYVDTLLLLGCMLAQQTILQPTLHLPLSMSIQRDMSYSPGACHQETKPLKAQGCAGDYG